MEGINFSFFHPSLSSILPSKHLMQPIRKAVIPIAGYGTRLFPATKAIPKALFPIVDLDGIAKPAIQIIVAEALAAGVEEVCLVIQPDQQAPIEAYFLGEVPDAMLQKAELRILVDEVADIGKRIQFAVQESQEGFGHAVYCAKDFVGAEPFLVLIGDHVYISNTDTPCAKQLVEVYEQTGKSVTSIEQCHESRLHMSGLVRGDRVPDQPGLFALDVTAEKPDIDFARKHLRVEGLPEHTYLCNFGIDLLTPLLFDVLDYNYKHNIRTKGEIQLRDAMGTVMNQEGMFGYLVQGHRYDTGIPQNLLRTIATFGQHGPHREVVEAVFADV